MKNIAVLLAAGSGSRFASEIPKQFVKVGEKMLMEYSVDTFQHHPGIDEIAIVVQENMLPIIERLKAENRYPKLKKIIIGGKERYESTQAVINHYKKETELNLLIHDAVRPFVSEKMISNVLVALEDYNAVSVAIPAIDTIYEVSEDNMTTGIPKRNMLRQAQTPQAFKLSAIRKAFHIAGKDPYFTVSDDISVIFQYTPEEKILIIDGDIKNIKITYREELKSIER